MLPSPYPWNSGPIQWARGDVGLQPSAAARPCTHLSVHDTAHPMSAASVRPRSAADCLIRSAVDIFHPRHQGNPPASSSVASGPVRSDIINGLGASTVGGGGIPSLVSSMTTDVGSGPVDSASVPPLSGRGNYLPTQSQVSYHCASSSPLARRPSSAFDGVNEEADVRANVAVADGHADVRASAAMTNDNDDDADDGIFDDTLCEILGAYSGSPLLSTLISFFAPSTSTSTSLALHFPTHSHPSPLSSPLLLLLLLLGSPSEIQKFSL